MENPIINIDYAALQTQKQSLMLAIKYFEKNRVPEIPTHLEGILNLIDSIQDYAVDEILCEQRNFTF